MKERSEDSQVQKKEFLQVLETAKKEVQRKYQDELKQVKLSIREFKKRFVDEMLSKEKEFR